MDNDNMAEPSILIIGAGTFGISIAFHLAKTHNDPSLVTIIDRQPSPPERAAAIDINRIIRTDYANPLYCNLAYEAIHDWFWSIELSAHFRMVGWLYLEEEGSNVSKRVKKVFSDRSSDRTEDVDLLDLGARWEALKGTITDGFQSAYFNPTAGYCHAAAATKIVMDTAIERGVKRVTAEVTELLFDKDSNKIRGVRTADGREFKADKIILAAGAWTSKLLSPLEDTLNVQDDHRIENQVQATGAVAAYYKVSDADIDRFSQPNNELPVIVYGQRGEVIPASKSNHLLKYSNSIAGGNITNTTTTSSGHKISMPADRSQYDVPEKLKQETKESIVSNIMPEMTKSKEPEYWRICWDALTPTEDWLMCRHPNLRLGNLYLAVGGSFHSYKFLPIAGKYMLNVLKGKSNGEAKDKAWAWKSKQEIEKAKEGKQRPRELRDLFGEKSDVNGR